MSSGAAATTGSGCSDSGRREVETLRQVMCDGRLTSDPVDLDDTLVGGLAEWHMCSAM